MCLVAVTLDVWEVRHAAYYHSSCISFVAVTATGLTFWANVDSRIDTTMTILLSVSALYVVILSNIPLLGYLTRLVYIMNECFRLLFAF